MVLQYILWHTSHAHVPCVFYHVTSVQLNESWASHFLCISLAPCLDGVVHLADRSFLPSLPLHPLHVLTSSLPLFHTLPYRQREMSRCWKGEMWMWDRRLHSLSPISRWSQYSQFYLIYCANLCLCSILSSPNILHVGNSVVVLCKVWWARTTILTCLNLWVACAKKRSCHINACVQEYNKGGGACVCVVEECSWFDNALSPPAGPPGSYHPRYHWGMHWQLLCFLFG